MPTVEAATWLDRERVADAAVPVRDTGFGREVRTALAQRRQWLVTEQLAEERSEGTVYRPGMLAALQRRELLRVAGQLSDETGVPFAEARVPEPLQGRLVSALQKTSGRPALLERSRDVTLVPWRAALEGHLVQSASGLMLK